MGVRFVIGWQTRPQFAFAETRPEAGTSLKTLKKPPRERYQEGRELAVV
jgi:hypothetical protein